MKHCWSSLHLHAELNRWVTSMNASSLHGMVRPPMGWLKPNSSSANLRSSWNEGWLRYDIGTMYLFLSASPTYTVTWPFGILCWTFIDVNFNLRTCLALEIAESNLMAIVGAKASWLARDICKEKDFRWRVYQFMCWKAYLLSYLYRLNCHILWPSPSGYGPKCLVAYQSRRESHGFA